MDASERKRLIAKAKEQSLIKKAIAEEKKIIASKPVHAMPKDERLAHLPKQERVDENGKVITKGPYAVDIIAMRRANMKKGIEAMNASVNTEKKAEEKTTEKPEPKTRGRSKKVT